jgi:hypothetical protein
MLPVTFVAFQLSHICKTHLVQTWHKKINEFRHNEEVNFRKWIILNASFVHGGKKRVKIVPITTNKICD